MQLKLVFPLVLSTEEADPHLAPASFQAFEPPHRTRVPDSSVILLRSVTLNIFKRISGLLFLEEGQCAFACSIEVFLSLSPPITALNSIVAL